MADKPIEVTDAMIRAARREDGRLCEFQDADVAAIFRAMLAAGPKELPPLLESEKMATAEIIERLRDSVNDVCNFAGNLASWMEALEERMKCEPTSACATK